MKSWLHFIVLILILKNYSTNSQSIITTLPGYNGTLPFKLETGYIDVGEKEEVQLFYYFIQSERDPQNDPLVLWLTGGPGCSAFSGLVYENLGPLAFDLEAFDGSLPSFIINPYSWTKISNIIFIDSPVGTGFSYASTPQGYESSDTIATKHNYVFLKKWFLTHPTFLKNRLYIAGDSYGGKIVPMVALEIVKGNEAGIEPQMSLQGYAVGNSLTESNKDNNERIPYAHKMALISDEYYELAKSSCRGDYVSSDSNALCLYGRRLVEKCTNNINTNHILEANCKFLTPKPDDHIQRGQIFVHEDPIDLLVLSKQEQPWCRNNNYVTSYIWANDETVQEALHIRKGTKTQWSRCNKTLSYESDIESVFEYHKLLNEKGYQTLAYSGDHDMLLPYMSTLKWIRALNLTVDDRWRPWTVDGQVAGYTEKYKNGEGYITFATVKGAGHTAPEYKPKECFEMVKRWFSSSPL